MRDWEQGRRQPERAARILLAMIDRAPETVEKVMRGLEPSIVSPASPEILMAVRKRVVQKSCSGKLIVPLPG